MTQRIITAVRRIRRGRFDWHDPAFWWSEDHPKHDQVLPTYFAPPFSQDDEDGEDDEEAQDPPDYGIEPPVHT